MSLLFIYFFDFHSLVHYTVSSIIFTPWKFFTEVWVTSLFKSPGLFSVFWLISKMQLVRWSPPPPSRYFQVLQSLYQSFGDCTKSSNYNWYNRHFHMPQFFFNSLARSKYLSFFSHSFNFTLWSVGTAKSTIPRALFFDYYNVWSSGWDLVIRLYLKIPEEFVRLIF